MSTCQGAPAPHLNCPHGDRCDWKFDYRTTVLPHVTSIRCDDAKHADCSGCACQCHRIRALR